MTIWGCLPRNPTLAQIEAIIADGPIELDGAA